MYILKFSLFGSIPSTFRYLVRYLWDQGVTVQAGRRQRPVEDHTGDTGF